MENRRDLWAAAVHRLNQLTGLARGGSNLPVILDVRRSRVRKTKGLNLVTARCS